MCFQFYIVFWFIVGQLVATDGDGDDLEYGIQNTAPQYLSSDVGDAYNYLRVETDGRVFTKAPIDREARYLFIQYM